MIIFYFLKVQNTHLEYMFVQFFCMNFLTLNYVWNNSQGFSLYRPQEIKISNIIAKTQRIFFISPGNKDITTAGGIYDLDL